MAQITSLTPEQEARYGEFVERWTRIGRETTPANRAAAEEYITLAYKNQGYKPPKFVWCGDPEEAVRLREKAEKKAGITGNGPLQDICWGQHDAGLFAFYEFFREVCGLVAETEPIVPHMMVAQAAGWWLPSEGVCWVVERPLDLHFDEDNRLHNEEGAAVEYPSGWKMFVWHNVRVPEDIIMDRSSISSERIFKERNAEVRRAMVSLFGMDRWIEESGAKLIQQDEYGQLFEVQFSGDPQPEKFVRVVNGTPELDGSQKLYVLPTWPEVTSAHEAVARSFGKTKETYAPKLRT